MSLTDWFQTTRQLALTLALWTLPRSLVSTSPLPVIQGLQSQPLDGHWRVRLLCVGASPLHNLGQTKVADLGNVALAQQHVARSQVTMKNLRGKCKGKRTEGSPSSRQDTPSHELLDTPRTEGAWWWWDRSARPPSPPCPPSPRLPKELHSLSLSPHYLDLWRRGEDWRVKRIPPSNTLLFAARLVSSVATVPR